MQLVQQKAALGVIGLDLLLEAAGIAAAVPLGSTQRKAGAAHELLGARAMVGGTRGADAGGDLPHPVHKNWAQQRGAHLPVDIGERHQPVGTDFAGSTINIETGRELVPDLPK